jgi:hypothetical protein
MIPKTIENNSENIDVVRTNSGVIIVTPSEVWAVTMSE